MQFLKLFTSVDCTCPLQGNLLNINKKMKFIRLSETEFLSGSLLKQLTGMEGAGRKRGWLTREHSQVSYEIFNETCTIL